MEIYLPARQPFSLRSVTRSHGWVQLAPFDQADDSFTYVDGLATGRVIRLHVDETDDGVRITTNVEIEPQEQHEVADKIAWMLGLDQDLSHFYALAAREPKLARMAAAAQGRVLRCPTLFEDTVKTILTTNTLWAGTKRMVRTLVERYGQPLPDDETRRAFPTPERLADVDPDEFRTEAKLGYRAPSVAHLARSVASGELNLELLKQSDLPTAELRKRLLSIKGVGPYAAANLLIILGRYDFLPIDTYALKVVSEEFHGGKPVGPAQVEAAFASWGEWKGLAFWFWEYAES